MYLYFCESQCLIDKYVYTIKIDEIYETNQESFNVWNIINHDDGSFNLYYTINQSNFGLYKILYGQENMQCVFNHPPRMNEDYAKLHIVNNRFVTDYKNAETKEVRTYCLAINKDIHQWKSFDENDLESTNDCQVCLTTDWPGSTNQYFLK